MTSVKFHLRTSYAKEERQRRLYVRMIHERKTLSVSLPYQLYTKEWDSKRQRVIISFDSHRLNYLKMVEKGLHEEETRLSSLIKTLENRGEFTVSTLKTIYLERKEGHQLTIFTAKLCKELNKEGLVRTARAYISTVKCFIEFTKQQDILFTQINRRLICSFENDMKKKGKSLNTISFYMRNLRAIYNKAIREEVFEPLDTDIFKDVYTGNEITPKRALTKEEMYKLCSLEIIDPILLTSFRLFLFSFLSRGMSFVDMAYLKKENLDNGVITYYRKKTGQFIEVTVNAQIQQLLYCFEEQTKESSYLLPIITRNDISERLQYESALRLQNKRLKIIADMCGLKKTLSTHVARHSWASIAKMVNLPLAIISEGLGHTSMKTTSIYLASFNRSVIDRANEKVTRLISNII